MITICFVTRKGTHSAQVMMDVEDVPRVGESIQFNNVRNLPDQYVVESIQRTYTNRTSDTSAAYGAPPEVVAMIQIVLKEE